MKRSAFTLLELMLAMTLVAMLSITLYASFNIAYKAKRSAERAVRPARAASIAAEMIQRDLEAAVPPPPSTNLNAASLFASIGFYGTREGNAGTEADWVEFCALGSDFGDERPTAEGMRRVQIGLRTDVNPPVLVRRVTRNLNSPVEIEPEDEIICRDVKSFTLQYFDGEFWDSEWDSTVATIPLPTYVQMDLVMNIENSAQRGTEPVTYRITRVIRLPMARLQ